MIIGGSAEDPRRADAVPLRRTLLIRDIDEADVYDIGRAHVGRAVRLLHMTFVIVALAPFAGARTRRTARALAPVSAVVELGTLAATAFRRS